MTMMIRRTRVRKDAEGAIRLVPIDELVPDSTNPREASEARLGLLRLSLAKLGFMMPVYTQRSTGLLLSGHQRLRVAREIGLKHIPVMDIDIRDDQIKGINLLFNRVTNDMTPFDTGSKGEDRIDMRAVAEAAEALPDCKPGKHPTLKNGHEDILPLVEGHKDDYDKKATYAAHTLLRKGIKIPAVVSESGRVVNGIHRLFSALEAGVKTWPIVRISDEHADVATQFLNYLSMDYKIDGDFKNLLRAGAFRRISNCKGTVPKSYRFWANGEKGTIDRESYTPEAWNKFRQIHGNNVLDFGAGLCKVAPYLASKGFNAHEFEPYRFEPGVVSSEPSPAYSRLKAQEFLKVISNPKERFDSIFLSAVMNSIPFPEDRLKVLAIVHALCSRATHVYGTCRAIEDFTYEYGGERRGVYFVMDGEPGVRLGDVSSRPKLQKFHSQDEAMAMFSRFWKKVEFWKGGNVFFFRLSSAMAVNPAVLGKSLDYEFGDLPFLDGTTMGLADEAKQAFAARLGLPVDRLDT